MSFDYIASYYGKRFKRGQIVKVETDHSHKPAPGSQRLGVVVKATNHIWVRLSNEKHAHPYHPSDVEPAERRLDAILRQRPR